MLAWLKGGTLLPGLPFQLDGGRLQVLLRAPLAAGRRGPGGTCTPPSQSTSSALRRTHFSIFFSRAMHRMVTQMETTEPRKSQNCSVS